MRYRPLGGTGVHVSPYALGTMMFGAVGNPDRAACHAMLERALDAGINLVDTADMYSAGESEEILGEALGGSLRSRRDDIVVATKGHFPLAEGPNRGGNSRRWLTRAVEDSLRRLQVEHIDLYQVHRPDPTTDVEETLSVLTDLVRAGKIRAFGSSSFPPEQVVEAQWVAERRGLMRFRTEQPPYSLLTRGIERSLLPVARAHGMGVLTWSPLAFGFLTGRHRRGTGAAAGTARAGLRPERFDPSLPENSAKYDAVEALVALSEEVGCTLPQLAVAFVVAHPAVSSVILGPRTPEQLDDLLAGAGLTLGDDVLDRIDEIVAPGVDLYRANTAWTPPALTDADLRRRPLGERSAA
ncbi:aldo/keto reductase [Intrasporangium sp. YIM S08009]|uniref:aldo/keto reductase n=1 Tax=Intrasporangium zincisolvens TaxID=3080018 RepID=UPI002B05FE59|nr:aldo/keto reductase [Intrasporangium sp. YIM S08009]